MVEQIASRTRRSRRPRPFALSFILLSVSTGCVEIRVCIVCWVVDREHRAGGLWLWGGKERKGF
jgi:hypothetical protein